MIVELIDADNRVVAAGKVGRYSNPEETLVKHLGYKNRCEMTDPYAKDSVIEIDGVRHTLSYVTTEVNSNVVEITFRLNK